MQTQIHRDHWKNINATTTVDMPELGERRFMRINTSKSSGSGALTTMVSVSQRSEDGRSYTHTMFRDYCVTVAKEKVRCTEKAVTAQHQAALARIEEIKQAARDHYGVTVAA